jgi:hypothetical protein
MAPPVLKTGDWVEIRSAAEILASLDGDATVARLPFMPEMLRYCGQRFQVSSVAHKTCDTVSQTGGRAVPDTVHLADLRCDGAAHGGCQAACLLYWKSAWLRPVAGPGAGNAPGASPVVPIQARERLAAAATRGQGDRGPVWRCQATTLLEWTRPLPWWDLRQYVRDVTTGNVPLATAAKTLFLGVLWHLRRVGVGYRLAVALHDRCHEWLFGRPTPFGQGRIPRGEPTPDVRLGLRPGERVRLRSQAEVLATVNTGNRNRGLSWDPEMAAWAGRDYVVEARVERIINEKTGEMMEFGNPCIRLAGVFCQGYYSRNRRLCPRRITPYFREAWLERKGPPG